MLSEEYVEMIDLCDMEDGVLNDKIGAFIADVEEGEIVDQKASRTEANYKARERMLEHIAQNRKRAELQRLRHQEFLAKQRQRCDPRLKRNNRGKQTLG